MADFDIKEKIDEVVKKIKGDEQLLQKFKTNPIPTVESILGINLPDEKIEPLIAGIKDKLAGGGLLNKLGGLFKK